MTRAVLLLPAILVAGLATAPLWASDEAEPPVREPAGVFVVERPAEAELPVEDEGPEMEVVPAREPTTGASSAPEGAAAGEGWEGPGTE